MNTRVAPGRTAHSQSMAPSRPALTITRSRLSLALVISGAK